MEFVANLLKLRITTALNCVEPPETGGFFPADSAHHQQTQRVLKHLALTPAEDPLAAFLEPGRLGSIKFACLLTRTHLYASRIKEPILLADIWEVDREIVGNNLYPTVSAGAYRYTLLCSDAYGRYLHDVLEAIHCAARLTDGAEAVFTAVLAARRDKTPLPEEPLSFIECTLDAERLLAHARVCLMEGRSREEGLNALLLSADLGCADAQYALALFFLQNAAQKTDKASAAYWFTQAAAQGHEAAARYLSVYGDFSRQKGNALWPSLRHHESLSRWAQGEPGDRQRAAALCLERFNHCFALTMVLTDWGMNPDADKTTCCLRSFEVLKEARAWLEYGRLLGSGKAEERLKALAQDCRSTVINDVIPALQTLHRDEDAFLCRLWLAELGDVPSRAEVAHHFLADKGLRRNPLVGLQWLEWAFEGHSVHAPGICKELGIAYVTGAHLAPKAWRTPLPPPSRDRAIGFYLLERGRCADALKRHLPTAPDELAALAEELDDFPFPFAAELTEKYRTMATAPQTGCLD